MIRRPRRNTNQFVPGARFSSTTAAARGGHPGEDSAPEGNSECVVIPENAEIQAAVLLDASMHLAPARPARKIVSDDPFNGCPRSWA